MGHLLARMPFRHAVALAASMVLLAGCVLDGTPLATPPTVRDPDLLAGDGPMRAMVGQVQERLDRLGYAPGGSDGELGPRTRAAIQRYQADMGLKRDGLASEDLVVHLDKTLADRARLRETQLLGTLPMPTYAVGDTFVYSDGRIDRVADRRDDLVFWRTNLGSRYVAYENFVMPWIEWHGPGQSGRRSVDAPPDLLWPLTPGVERTFEARARIRYRDRPDAESVSREAWSCATQGRERVTIELGVFDTAVVQCHRTEPSSAPHLKRVWYYSPRLRHFVRQLDLYQGFEVDRRVDLVAMWPDKSGWPPAARGGLKWALDHALESLPDGRETLWKSSAVEARVRIRPTATLEGDDGTTCRSFEQIWSDSSGRRVYPGIACRTQEGLWRIQGTEGGWAYREPAGAESLSSLQQ